MDTTKNTYSLGVQRAVHYRLYSWNQFHNSLYYFSSVIYFFLSEWKKHFGAVACLVLRQTGVIVMTYLTWRLTTTLYICHAVSHDVTFNSGNKNWNIFTNLSTSKLFLDVYILIRLSVIALKREQASLCLQTFSLMLCSQSQAES